MQRFRRHLSYANIVATLALVVAMAGGAYAVNQVGTRDVKNNSLRSDDLKNRRAVAGRDIRRDSIGGSEIREKDLRIARLVRVGGSDELLCDPSEGGTTECASTSISLVQPMSLQVVATGAFSSRGAAPAEATCAITVDGREEVAQLNPGEATSVNTSQTSTDGFAATYTSEEAVQRGPHSIALTCEQTGSADAVIEDPSIAVIAVAAP